MTARNAKPLTLVPPPTSPDERIRDKRARLADAIVAATVEAGEIAKEETNARDALDRGMRLSWAARENLDKAEAAVERARRNQGERLVELTLSGGDALSDTTVRDAEVALKDAQEKYDAARAFYRQLEEAMAGRRPRKAEAQAYVERIANNILWSRVERLLEEAKAVQEDLINRRTTLQFLLSLQPDRDDPLAMAVRNFLAEGIYIADWNNHPASNKWRQAREALAKDAEAPLPER